MIQLRARGLKTVLKESPLTMLKMPLRPMANAFMRKTIKRCENCDSELESTRKSNLCEACEKEQLQKNVKKGAAAAAAIGLAKVVIPKVAPYAKKAAPLVANAVKKIVLR